ncbi:serine hydrolase domain-containing protein [Actinomadura rubrisoli]|uniref:Class A beta-lactamase-related serine hydrolase n=1 Tax=Actinomadura rubrisoli TaxID=2530368 RepID=A0A4R5B4Z9_9ACTN|nr:serine hydrolase domain-containing protein [Actinomadura rubrisoli]TDD79909.1 class A beta-lactamase-related serine hydrolase [Actinomadura rubrisoli]
MTRPRPCGPLSRRSALGVLGAVPVAAGTALVAPGIAGADQARNGPVPRDLRPGGAFDRHVAKLAAEDKFSGSLLLAHQGKAVLARAYGKANKRLSIPNRPDTTFVLASMTKMFTAVALVQLAERGKVDFFKTLGTYVKGFPADIADKVTVHQLLTHTSGMGDHTQEPEWDKESTKWTSTAEVWNGTLAIIRKMPLKSAPGTQFGYSNAGFCVLGEIVAQVSGQSYYDYVRDNVFTKAGMAHTAFYTKPQWQTDKRIAHPYGSDPSGGPRVDRIDDQTFIGSPAGNAFSPCADMIRFGRALHGGKLLDHAFKDLAMSGKVSLPPTPSSDSAVQTTHWGYGFIAWIYNNQRIVGHTGGSMNGGISTMTDTYPDLDWEVAILMNYDDLTVLNALSSHARRLITRSS